MSDLSTLIVKAKGDIAIHKLNSIAFTRQFYGRSSIKVTHARWFQYLPRIEVHFHDLTAQEVSTIKVKLAFIADVYKVREIKA
jgi:hypothetical protein